MNQFSIILPVRNGGYYVKDCLKSILAQTYQNFDIIVLDNNSSDGTKEWIESLNNNKITIYPSAKDLSITDNWARVANVTKNKFSTLIGHDDILYPNFLEEINNLIIQHPNASLYHTHFNFINKNGEIIKPCKPMPNSITKESFIELFLENKIDSMGTGYVFKSSTYDALGGIPIKYANLLYADFELWYQLTSIGNEVISPKNCFAFRIHQSTTTTSSINTKLKAFRTFVDFLVSAQQKDLSTTQLIEKHSKTYLDSNCQSMCHKLIKTPLQFRDKNTSVTDLINEFKVFASKLNPSNPYNPIKNKSILIAKIIDSNWLFKNSFLIFKSYFKKPILK